MPKRGESCLFLPRLKEGEDPKGPPRHIRINYKVLEGLFHLPLKDAARQIGLCPTTFKRACRRFDLEQWPFRMRHSGIPFARRAHQTNHTVSVSRTSPVGHDGMRDTSAFCFPFSTLGSGFSSAAPQGLLQQASMVIDTRSYGGARHAGPAFEHKIITPLDAPSYIDTSTRGSVVIGAPMTCPSPVGRDTSSFAYPFSSIACYSSNVGASPELHRDSTSSSAGGSSSAGSTSAALRATPLKTCPPQERLCVEAVLDYLDLGCSISQADVESMLSDDY